MDRAKQVQVKQAIYEPVDASPVKSFFVSMLTRDITLEEAILDLLDNCVDGILRSKKSSGGKAPFNGYRAEIEFKKDLFSISDNCGGIPWDLHDYAFRMGRSSDRPQDKPGTVGVYGIGMKRAMFKMGKHCLVSTQNGKHRYDVEIKPEWIDDEKLWEIPVKANEKVKGEDGTMIVIGSLYPGVAARFNDDAKDFERGLRKLVSSHYAFIINKGFEVIINKKSVLPKPINLFFDKGVGKSKRIRPFVFKTRTEDGVDVFLAVGFTRPLPTEEEIRAEHEEIKYSSIDAGWTILCNDRAVVYCDRTELTGWGDAGIPRYHTQFIAISGIVEFRCADASKLPTTTTKRGIDAASPLFLQVKNKMREGMRIFINYTNEWKGRVDESKKQIEGGKALSIEEVKVEVNNLPLTSTKRTTLKGMQFKPDLPSPKLSETRMRRISFVKNLNDIEAVGDFLFKDTDADPSSIGEKCCDLILEETRK